MRGVWALAVALGLAWGQGGTTRPGAPASTPRGRWRRPRPPASWASWSPPRTGRSCGFSCASTWTRGGGPGPGLPGPPGRGPGGPLPPGPGPPRRGAVPGGSGPGPRGGRREASPRPRLGAPRAPRGGVGPGPGPSLGPGGAAPFGAALPGAGPAPGGGGLPGGHPGGSGPQGAAPPGRGRLAEAASLLEEVRSRLSPESPLYREALAALVLARFGRLDGQGGFPFWGSSPRWRTSPAWGLPASGPGSSARWPSSGFSSTGKAALSLCAPWRWWRTPCPARGGSTSSPWGAWGGPPGLRGDGAWALRQRPRPLHPLPAGGGPAPLPPGLRPLPLPRPLPLAAEALPRASRAQGGLGGGVLGGAASPGAPLGLRPGAGLPGAWGPAPKPPHLPGARPGGTLFPGPSALGLPGAVPGPCPAFGRPLLRRGLARARPLPPPRGLASPPAEGAHGGLLGLALGWVVAGVVMGLFPSAWLRRF